MAKALAGATGARLIRLQCHEGIDLHHALYDWDYPRQLLHLRRAAPAGEEQLYSERFLLRRPLLEALQATEPVVLLIDEIDRADDEFEAFLLELLSDFQVSIPELGTVVARAAAARGRHLEPDARAARRAQAPLPVPLDRLPRRREREAEIVRARLPGVPDAIADAGVRRGRAAARRGALQAARAWARRSPGRRRCSRWTTPTSTRRSASC